MLKERDLKPGIVIQKEKPNISTIYLDESGRQLKVGDGGQIISFSKHETPWKVFLRLALDTEVYVPSKVIKKIESESGYGLKGTAVKSIWVLRGLMGDLEARSLILMRGSSRQKNIEYKLNAHVVSIKGPKKAEIFPEELKFPLVGLQLKAARAFFALNGEELDGTDGTDYKFPFVADLRAEVFNDEFKNKLTPEEKGNIIRIRFGSAFQQERINFISWLRKLMLEPSLPLEKLSPETREFKQWFDSIPVYKGLSVDDLVLIVQRKKSFKQLKELKERKEVPR